ESGDDVPALQYGCGSGCSIRVSGDDRLILDEPEGNRNPARPARGPCLERAPQVRGRVVDFGDERQQLSFVRVAIARQRETGDEGRQLIVPTSFEQIAVRKPVFDDVP